jgi:predicted Rossmann fold nucleotide-binding protein DprA/Smf involved in DNA uptake
LQPFDTSADTQAVLLLTARFATRSSDAANPLTAGQYNKLAVAMNASGLRPADLLTDSGSAFVSDAEAHTVEPRRLKGLLERSMALALSLESWTNAGFWVMSRGDDTYPTRLRERLKSRAPAVLFGCGEPALLDQGGLAVIGSRNIDEPGEEFTRDLARAAAAEGIQVVSGGARGVDSIAMEAALERGGSVVGVLANDLAKTSRSETAREAIQDDRLCLVSPFQPDSRFEAWKAMDRNKSIYALSDWALVVASDLRKGGTWAGAKENLDGGWVPLFVRAGVEVPKGNDALISMGATPFTADGVQVLRSALESSELIAREAPGGSDGDSDLPQMSLF